MFWSFFSWVLLILFLLSSILLLLCVSIPLSLVLYVCLLLLLVSPVRTNSLRFTYNYWNLRFMSRFKCLHAIAVIFGSILVCRFFWNCFVLITALIFISSTFLDVFLCSWYVRIGLGWFFRFLLFIVFVSVLLLLVYCLFVGFLFWNVGVF